MAARRPAALVTGASTGLGYAIAIGLAEAGYDLAATGLSLAELEPLLAEPAVKRVKVVPLALDLRQEASIDAAFDAAIKSLGTVDLLVNNAGRALIKPAVEITWAEWDDVVDINLRGAFLMAQRFARLAIHEKHCADASGPAPERAYQKVVVNIASTHGMTGIAGRSVYGISKAGLIQMAKMLAIEWAPHGIRVNAIAPTTVMTPSRQALLADPAKRTEMLGRIPLARFPDPSEIAAAVVYLASPAAASVTGHTLLLDGGLTAA